MKYRLRHRTEFTYAAPVDLAVHWLHLSPRVLAGQIVRHARVEALPEPVRTVVHRDYFGNESTWLFHDQPHERFAVTLAAEIEVAASAPPADCATLPWEEVVRFAARAPTAAEFLYPSPLLPAEPEARHFAQGDFPPGRPILAGLRALSRRIHSEFAYRPGVTDISTPVAKVLARREGVCQDFAHLMVAALRGMGLPARYVSGYLRTRPPPGKPRRRGADQSHAWVGCWLGPEHGWIGLDPTNDLVVADEHVVLAWGRDYADVSPVRGVLLGGGKHSLRVSVDLDVVGYTNGNEA